MTRRKRKPYSTALMLWLVTVIVIVFAILSVVELSPLLVFVAAVNVATFCLYGFDKWQSVRHGNRVPENILYLVTLLGGTVGALIGMHLFRHKTRKGSFQIVVALIMLVQIGLIIWLMW